MNFLNLDLADDGLHLATDQALRILAPPGVLKHGRAHGLSNIVLGIRPHMVELARLDTLEVNVVPAKLLDAALVGRDLQVDYALAGQRVMAVLPAEVELQRSGALRLPPEHCFFFAPDGARVG